MKTLLFGFLSTVIALTTSAQTNIFKKKRIYNVEGYILLGTDTINGTISIPIINDELDYNSLGTSVTFTDSLNKTKKYTPVKAPGFGLRGDAVFGDYVSIGVSEGLDRDLFLKKVLDGKIILFENKLDRKVTTYKPNAFGTRMIQNEDINESIYYLKKGSEPLIKIQFNSKTLTIKKKELKKLIDILPDNFSNSDEEIHESELITILSDYNFRVSKE